MALASAQVADMVAQRITGQTAAGARVFTSRLWPLTEAELPAWRVTVETESAEAVQLSGINEHLVEMSAAGYVRAVADLDDSMHNLAEQGLTALWATQPPHDLQLLGIDREMATEGEASVGVITLRLRARIFVAPGAPGTII